jgi:hypothetical protein
LEANPNKNMYELLSQGENIPTSEIIGNPIFDARKAIIEPIMEENHDCVASPSIKINILEHEEEYLQSPNKHHSIEGTIPNQPSSFPDEES